MKHLDINTYNHSSLFKQFILYNGRLAIICIGGLSVGIFLLLFFIQKLTRFDTWNYEQFMYVFMGLFMVLAILYAGSSFPGLRSRDRATHYLMVPVSTTRKFIFEICLRVVLFAILLPGIYWVIFHLEGYIMHLINPAFAFRSFSYIEGFHLPDRFENIMMMLFVVGQGLLFLTVPFLGATVFMKHQIVKTVAWAFGLLFVFFALFNGFIQHNLQPEFLWVFNCFVFLLNLIFVGLAFLKLKNKQV